PGPGESNIDYATTERALASTSGSMSIVAMFRLLELERRFWRGDFAGVVEAYRVIAPTLATIPAQAYNAELRFYYCLAAIALGDTDPALDLCHADLARYAEACPANFGHM